MAVEVEGQETTATGSAPAVAADWLVEEEDDEPAHH
jgi:F-type H+-transporting ATPase subunit h